jgi:DNA-binding NarL/FixJ family response regulator
MPTLHGAARQNALQVADRWHLIHNHAEALKRFSVRALAMLRAEWKAEELPPTISPFISPPPAPSRTAARTERRHAEIHALLAQGLNLSSIAHRLGFQRRTVLKFCRC